MILDFDIYMLYKKHIHRHDVYNIPLSMVHIYNLYYLLLIIVGNLVML
jgi:hypothetical protein